MTADERQLLEEKYDKKETPEYESDKKRLEAGEPLAYVIGWQPFLGLKIYLDSRPLIPRSETEWWMEQLLAKARECQLEDVSQRDGARHSKFLAKNYACPRDGVPARLSFLDLCAGSGAIGCTALKMLPHANVFFGEIDLAHKTTILKNIRENHLDEARAKILIGDLFEPFGDMKFDVIAANPPYIPTARVLPASVALYEPARALYAGADGLDVIRRIAKELPKHLAEGGMAWIECDSPTAETARALFVAQGLSARICNDQYGVPRVIVVHPVR
jgi:methylase of polypeptide subunit release factors